MDEPCAPLSFLGRPIPEGFERRVVVLEPGARVDYVEADWTGALVVVEVGRIELECERGGRRGFREGAVLCLDGIALRALHNPAGEAAVVSAIARERLLPESRGVLPP
jgi:hypothetical protein